MQKTKKGSKEKRREARETQKGRQQQGITHLYLRLFICINKYHVEWLCGCPQHVQSSVDNQLHFVAMRTLFQIFEN